MKIVGAVYEIETGRVRFLHPTWQDDVAWHDTRSAVATSLGLHF
jgi:hypothetical protein